jgi:hypothetical protein
VKVSSISPQFVFEPLPGEKAAQEEKAADELGLKLVRTEAAATAADSEKLDSETRDGLKRLSQLIRRNKKSSSEKSGDASQQKKRRALLLYQSLSEGRDPQDGCGENLDEYI